MKLTIVIVLYKIKLDISTTLQTIRHTEFFKNQNVRVIIYDHSPVRQEFNKEYYNGVQIVYIHDPRNLGLATAYNYAFQTAQNHNDDWLLLLDHDTEITEEFADKIFNLPKVQKGIAAIVPKVEYEGTVISPVFGHTTRPLKGQRPVSGVQDEHVMAINSGTLLNMNFLKSIAGFNEDFPLDYLDHWLFFEIYHQGWKVLILDVKLMHDLSVMNYQRVSFERYKSILDSETLYYRKYKKENFNKYKIQLLNRSAKQLLTVKNKKIPLLTIKRLFSLLFNNIL